METSKWRQSETDYTNGEELDSQQTTNLLEKTLQESKENVIVSQRGSAFDYVLEYMEWFNNFCTFTINSWAQVKNK